MDIEHTEKDVTKFEGDGNLKHNFERTKETSTRRRARRLRADARMFSRLVKAGQAATSHHTSASELVVFLQQLLAVTRRGTSGSK